MSPAWSVHLATATGRHHLEAGTACQDAAAARTWPGGFAAAVSDGAGSAPRSDEGARILANEVVALCAARVGQAGFSWADDLPRIVEQARAGVLALARSQGHDARDYAATLVACVVDGNQGCFFHVGDGAGVHCSAAGVTIVSSPENGEFADETYFVTQDDWREHLRLTVIDGVGDGSLVGLMSDGAMPFVLDRSRRAFFPPFIDPVRRHLAGRTGAEGSAALLGVLQDPRTLDITSDDKTLVLAMRA